MKFDEAAVALLQGKMIKRAVWNRWMNKNSNDIKLEVFELLKDDWEIREEPKPPKLLAPALLSDIGHVEMSCYLYASEQEARDTLGDSFISWPAIPNKDGMYEVLSENIP
jgi:hypothetical protein